MPFLIRFYAFIAPPLATFTAAFDDTTSRHAAAAFTPMFADAHAGSLRHFTRLLRQARRRLRFVAFLMLMPLRCRGAVYSVGQHADAAYHRCLIRKRGKAK